MDNNNWRPIQGGEPAMDAVDWRTQLQPDSRQRIVNKIMDTLKKHLPFSGQEGLHELKKIAERFEEKIYTAATSQSDYLRKISLKMLTMETKSQNSIPNSLTTNPVGNNNRPPDPGQGNSLNSLQQVSVGSMQQNPVSAPQQGNINALSSQNGMNVLQSSISTFQPNSGMLQHQHIKQQQEQQMLQTQQLKQHLHQRQIQQQLLQKQQILQQQLQQQQQQQQLQQQPKQQLPAQLQTHQNQISQLHQMNDVNDMKMRQNMAVKPGVFQQHVPAGQRSAYPHQQLKTGSPFSVPSNHLQASSPQVLQHSSPQVDQQNLLSSLTKAGTPLQSANLPFVVPSPSTPLAPSPMPGDSDKPVPGIFSLPNAGNVGQQQASGGVAPAPSLAIGTPGISASSVLGMRRLVHTLVVIGWILVTVTFILGGIFLLLHNVVGDTCVAMDEWVQNPTADSALDGILPYVQNTLRTQNGKVMFPKFRKLAFAPPWAG